MLLLLGNNTMAEPKHCTPELVYILIVASSFFTYEHQLLPQRPRIPECRHSPRYLLICRTILEDMSCIYSKVMSKVDTQIKGPLTNDSVLNGDKVSRYS